MSTRSRFNRLTAQGLDRLSGDYLDKGRDEAALVEALKERHGLDRVVRFDVGRNTDGFTPLAREVFDLPELQDKLAEHLQEYPDNQYRLLRGQLARRFGIDPDWFEIGAGLEAVIDQIGRAVLDPGDACLVPVPNFSLYEDGAARQGARLITPILPGPDLAWTPDFTDRMIRTMERERPRLVWVSSPLNPMGRRLPEAEIVRLAKAAGSCGALLVVDEAYGEYVDTEAGPVSAASLLAGNPQLLVLRTFSKMYGLPGARVGYAMSADPEVLRALRFYRPYFPFSWFSLYVCQLASLDEEWLAEARARLAVRRPLLEAGLDSISGLERLESDTNTIMLRHPGLGAELHARLAARGALTADLDRVTGIAGQGWLRVTVRSREDNAFFVHACGRATA